MRRPNVAADVKMKIVTPAEELGKVRNGEPTTGFEPRTSADLRQFQRGALCARRIPMLPLKNY
jgi:hypothetical protein